MARSNPAGRTRRGRNSFPRHQVDGITATCEIGVVRDENGRHPSLAVELFEQIEDAPGRIDVEVARRLVREEEARRAREGARDRDALLFAARRARGGGDRAARAGRRGRGSRPRGGAPRPAGLARDPVREGDVLLRRELRQQMVELKDKPDAVVAKASPLPRRELVERLAEDLHAPRVGAVDPSEEVQERGLPHPGGPHHGREDPLRQFEREVREDGHRSALACVGLRNVLGLYGEHGELDSRFQIPDSRLQDENGFPGIWNVDLEFSS